MDVIRRSAANLSAVPAEVLASTRSDEFARLYGRSAYIAVSLQYHTNKDLTVRVR